MSIIRKAKIADVAKMKSMINNYADSGVMLNRSLNEFYENLRDFIVIEEAGDIIACCALHICWDDLAEIKSLAVKEDKCGRGDGSKLVEESIKEAKALGIKKVFVLTYKSGFFSKFNFKPINKEELPHKIWNECINCPKFPDCDEEALILEI